MSDPSQWQFEGPIAVRYHEQDGHLIQETKQFDREIILERNKQLRNHDAIANPPRGRSGWYIGSIAFEDLPRVHAKYPELGLMGPKADTDLRRKALIRFTNDPDMEEYVLRKA